MNEFRVVYKDHAGLQRLFAFVPLGALDRDAAFDAISEIPLAHEDATITDPALATIFAETEGLQRGDELFARLPS